MTAPVRRNVAEGLEPVWDPVVDLLFVGISLGIRFADTFGDNTRVTFRMASVFAVLALHPRGILEEIPAQRTAHDVVELMLHELVPIHLVDLFLALTDSSFATKSQINWATVLILLDEIQGQMDRTSGLKIEPCVDRLGGDLRSCRRELDRLAYAGHYGCGGCLKHVV